MRQTVDVLLPAFVSSVHATSTLIDALTSSVGRLLAITEEVEVVTRRGELTDGAERPLPGINLKQRIHNEPINKTKI